jgi:hypothetical protein
VEGLRVTFEKSGNAASHRGGRRNASGKGAPKRNLIPSRTALDATPKLLDPHEPLFSFVAADDGCVNCADRCTNHPVGLDAGLMERLVHTALIGPESTTSLHDKHYLTIVVTSKSVHGVEWRSLGFHLVLLEVASDWAGMVISALVGNVRAIMVR